MATNDMTSAGQVWPQWIQSATSSSANTTAWTQWNDTGTAASVWTYWASTTNGTTNQPWTQWIQAPQGNQYTVTVGLPQRQQTTEEVAAWKRMVEEQERKKQNAQKRALELLKEILTKTQNEAFDKDKCIPVDAPSGKKYVIEKGRSGNVYSIKDGKKIERYCIHPSDQEVPEADVMLAQKLMLEADEEEFLRIANRTRLAA